MNQDGKPDPQALQIQTSEPTTGNLILTLCVPSNDGSGYLHATIPFPATYEEACAEALKTFAAHIPADTEAVSLCQAVKRMDGQHVWSIIRDDLWRTVVRKDGDEIGVFLPGAKPQRIPYTPQEKPARYVRFEYIHWNVNGYGSSQNKFGLVRSYDDCLKVAKSIVETEAYAREDFDLKFVAGSLGSSQSAQSWSILSPDDFDFLIRHQPEPLVILIDISYRG